MLWLSVLLETLLILRADTKGHFYIKVFTAQQRCKQEALSLYSPSSQLSEKTRYPVHV